MAMVITIAVIVLHFDFLVLEAFWSILLPGSDRRTDQTSKVKLVGTLPFVFNSHPIKL